MLATRFLLALKNGKRLGATSTGVPVFGFRPLTDAGLPTKAACHAPAGVAGLTSELTVKLNNGTECFAKPSPSRRIWTVQLRLDPKRIRATSWRAVWLGASMIACGCGRSPLNEPINANEGAPGTAGVGGTFFPCSTPQVVAATAIAVGVSHVCALMETGGVRCWGDNQYGQLGDGSTTNRSTMPAHDVLGDVQAIAAGGYHTCALMKSGGIRCWGQNDRGQLGDGTTTNRLVPPATDLLADVQAIAMNTYETCVVMKNGGVLCWGDNEYGQLGDGTMDGRQTPPANAVFSKGQSVAMNGQYVCVLTTTGGVRCWGRNDEGQLGDGTTIDRSTPPTRDVLGGVRAVAAGSYYTCALTTAGGVRCWGEGAFGQLGDGTTPRSRTIPTGDVIGSVQAIATGYYHACALTRAGGVRCWGTNFRGCLGRDPATSFLSSPPTHDVLEEVKAIGAGLHFTCALMSAGDIQCWGMNDKGQLGTNSADEADHPTPTAVLGTWECASHL